MRKLKIVTNRKIRNLSWKIRPVLMFITDADIQMATVFGACIFGLFLETL